MANYFQDPSQSFVPTPVYRPPFEAIQSVLSTKQQKYDSGLSNLRGIYSSIFNAPLTNSQNIDVRNQYLKEAEEKLKNLSEVDLSQENNQKEAAGVFSNFFKDESILRDVATTKYNTQQLAVGNSMLQSTDQKVKDGYFAESMRDIQNTMEDIRSGDRNNANIYKQRNYVIKRDIQKDLSKQIHDLGFEVVHIEGENEPQLVSIKGGERSLQNYHTIVQGLMGNNYDDMMGVYGRNEMHDRTNDYIQLGLTSDKSKELAAGDYIDEKSRDINKNIANFTKEIKNRESFIKTNQDANGKSLSSESEKKILWAKQNIINMNDQMTSAGESLSALTNHNSDDYKDIFNGITKMGDNYFGEVYKRTISANLATAHASSVSTKVEVNQAYQNSITNDLNHAKYMSDLTYKQAQIDHMGDDYTVDEDGNMVRIGKSKGKTAKVAGEAPLDALDIGLGATDPLKIENGYETYTRTIGALYESARGKQVDGLATMIPSALGLDIAPADAVAWAASMKENYSNGNKPNWNAISKPVQEKLLAYMKDNDIKITPGCPSCQLELLNKKVQEGLTSKIKSEKFFTEAEVKALELFRQGDSELEDYNQKNKVFTDKISKTIQDKIVNDPSFNKNLVKKDVNGKYVFIHENDILKELGDLPPAFNKVQWQVVNGIPIPMADPQFVSPKKIIEEFKKGEVKISNYLKEVKLGSGESIVLKDAYNRVANVLNKYKGYGETINSVNTATGEAMGSIDKEGFIGRELSYNITGPTATNSQGSDGNKLLANVLNSDNHELSSKDSDENNAQNRIINILKSNPEYASKIIYNALGIVTILLDKPKILKDEIAGIPKDVTTLKLKLSANAMGKMIDRQPKPLLYQKYQKLFEGQEVRSTKLDDALGYTWRVYPDNLGQKGTKATKLYYESKYNVWDPNSKSWIEDKDHPATTEEIPLSGDRAKAPDELMEKINSISNFWLRQNNQIKKNAAVAPGATPYVGKTIEEIEQQAKTASN